MASRCSGGISSDEPSVQQQRAGILDQLLHANEEAHGFALEANRLDFYTRVTKFLEKNLKWTVETNVREARPGT